MQIALQVTSMDFVSSVNKPVRIIIVYVIKEIYFKPSYDLPSSEVLAINACNKKNLF